MECKILKELSTVPDVVATFQDAVFIVGYVNIQIECSDTEYKAVLAHPVLCHYEFAVRPNAATHTDSDQGVDM